jgi:hypothetical protein
MSLLEPPAAPSKSRPMAIAGVAIAFIVVIWIWFMFRFYPETKAAEHFFDALVAGDTATAYKLWQPSQFYKMQDFLADWGPNGYYGTIKSYRVIKESNPGHSSAVAVEVAVSPYSPIPDEKDAEKSRRTRVITLWVEKKDKSFSFPP